ncbi:helix-turn-helix domain-containing protein [Paenibacillus sp. PAMC21692]|uniref:helix-turn-helix domain-containing protein n=1 Tax=Paenibacillus sp. PAMC21692 TaxID=2762320 RepID=UPI00164D5BA0|nr:helix-turn-helix domain-containing protein [Paenibacillus sp. PAMC21692]QNK59511.1 AraC family transcriptional regulator [Paenibacillus sp. PAMC21692]
MNLLFAEVKLGERTINWAYNGRLDMHFEGYYHWHQHCEILFIHEGTGSVIVNQQTYEIRSGMLFLFPPYKLHRVYMKAGPENPYIRTSIHFDQDIVMHNLREFPSRQAFFKNLWQGHIGATVFDLSGVMEQIEHCLYSFNKSKATFEDESEEENTFLFLLLLSIIRDADTDGSYNSYSQDIAKPVFYSEMIMRWIEEHFAEEVTLDRIAEYVHLSKFYAARIFRDETGSSIGEYLTVRRIRQACRLLHTTDLSVEQIGIKVGLPSTPYFIQLFKKAIGTTPLKYRKNN